MGKATGLRRRILLLLVGLLPIASSCTSIPDFTYNLVAPCNSWAFWVDTLNFRAHDLNLELGIDDIGSNVGGDPLCKREQFPSDAAWLDADLWWIVVQDSTQLDGMGLSEFEGLTGYTNFVEIGTACEGTVKVSERIPATPDSERPEIDIAARVLNDLRQAGC